MFYTLPCKSNAMIVVRHRGGKVEESILALVLSLFYMYGNQVVEFKKEDLKIALGCSSWAHE